jgi:hypothetical protein
MTTIRGAARVAAIVFSLSACSPAAEPEVPPLAVDSDVDEGAERDFAFTSLDGKPVTDEGYEGRMTVIGFVATYDIGSQAQARFINEVVAKHVPRINALLLVLEPPQHRPMVEAFASSLDLRYDVVHADAKTTAGKGPFPGLHHVPSVVLLDRKGREVWRNLGLITAEKLDEAIAEHDPRAR